MDTQDGGATLKSQCVEHRGAGQRLCWSDAQRTIYHGFARYAHKHRPVALQTAYLGQAGHKLIILFGCFGKAETGIYYDVGDPLESGFHYLRLQFGDHAGADAERIVGECEHIVGVAAGVHHDIWHSHGGHSGNHAGIHRSGRYVVDNVGSERHRLPGH